MRVQIPLNCPNELLCLLVDLLARSYSHLDLRYCILGRWGDRVPNSKLAGQVNWKYGFHLIWNDIEINTQKHRAFHNSLLRHMAPLWNAKSEANEVTQGDALSQDPRTNILPDFIREHNTLAEVLDTAIFTSTDTLRILYSNKMLPCTCFSPSAHTASAYLLGHDPQGKSCKWRQSAGSGKRKVPRKKGIKGRECNECGGSGTREGRLYEWLGFFDASTGRPDPMRSLPLLVDASDTQLPFSERVCLVRKRVQACSIRLS